MNKFYKREFYLTGLLLLFAVIGFAQVKVTGVVKGSDNGLTLPGASVAVKGTSVGVITDANGKYAIEVPKGGILTFSFIGYTTQELNVDGKTIIDVTLQSNAKGLNEVVVVGYGTQKKVNLTGSVSNVGSERLADRPATGLANALEGTVPGLTVISNNGQPGKDAGSINIRGIGTLNSTNPMIVIDGVISSTSEMNSINAEDVDNVSVLKDAASASIYGSRAANGVILVTTKRGKKETSQITYSTYFGKQNATDLPDYLPSWQAATLYNQARENEGLPAIYNADQIETFKNGSDPYNYPNTDWLKLFYNGSGFEQNHYLGMTGGNDKTQYAFSLGYFDQDGITQNTNTQRYTTRINLTNKVNDKLSVNASLSYTYQPLTEPQSSLSADQSFSQVIRQVNRISNIIPEKFANGDYDHISDGNPIAWVNSPSYNHQTAYNLQGLVGADWEIVKGLHFKPSLGYILRQDQDKNFVSSIQYYNADGSLSGTPNIANSTDFYDNVTVVTPQALLDYSIKLGDHTIKALAGYSQEHTGYYDLQGYAQGFLNNSLSDFGVAGTAGESTSDLSYQIALRSYFGRINYDYKGKYLLEVNLRDDGSSRFDPARRYGVYPSGSAGWRVSEEDFFSPLKKIVSNLKLRGSWGKLGNQTVAGTYPYVATVSGNQNYPFGGVGVSGVAPVTGYNDDITWETTTETDFGLDADFLNNKFSLTADYFNKTTTGILFNLPIGATYGLTSPYQNASSVQNKGWEFAVTYHEKAGDFLFNVSANTAFVANKVIALGPSASPVISGATITEVGQPVNEFYGYVTQGIFQTQAQINSHADQSGVSGPGAVAPGDLIYKDVNGDGKIDQNDKVPLGSNFPKVTFGLNLNVAWKNIDLTGFFQGAAGVKNLIQGIELGQNGNAVGKPTSALLNSWSPTNTNTDFPRLWINNIQNNPSDNPSSFWIRDASYVRLKNLQLGYTFPKAITNALHIQKLRIYYSGQNILTFTKFYKWVDPEAPLGESGYDYPQLKINTIGLNVTF